MVFLGGGGGMSLVDDYLFTRTARASTMTFGLDLPSYIRSYMRDIARAGWGGVCWDLGARVGRGAQLGWQEASKTRPLRTRLGQSPVAACLSSWLGAMPCRCYDRRSTKGPILHSGSWDEGGVGEDEG